MCPRMNDQARNKVEEHLWIVRFLLHRWKYRFPGSWEDLRSIIHEGLCQAGATDDPSHKAKFSTYAVTVAENLIKKKVKELSHTQGREVGVLDLINEEVNEAEAYNRVAPSAYKLSSPSPHTRAEIEQAMIARTKLQQQILQRLLDSPVPTTTKIAEELGCHEGEVRRIIRKVRANLESPDTPQAPPP